MVIKRGFVSNNCLYVQDCMWRSFNWSVLYLLDLLRIFLKQVSNKCQASFQLLSIIHPMPAWSSHQTCLKLVSTLPQTRLNLASNSPQVCLKLTSSLPKNHLKLALNSPQACLKITSSFPQSQHPQTISRLFKASRAIKKIVFPCFGKLHNQQVDRYATQKEGKRLSVWLKHTLLRSFFFPLLDI
jgi:hypothetical protein